MTDRERYDVAVVGGGIVGLAQAMMAAERGLEVALFERSAAAEGATARNFGMVWPVGQPAGELHDLAMRSWAWWERMAKRIAVRVEPCGSIHLAHRADELAVLEEFVAAGTHDVKLLSASEVVRKSKLANPDGLLGGMWSPIESRVDPCRVADSLASFARDWYSVELHFETPIVRVESGAVHASDGRVWDADKIIVCSGSDLRSLYPERFAGSGLRLCKLQMMRTVPQRGLVDEDQPFELPEGTTEIGEPHVASGLTLRHYAAFEGCDSLAALRRRIAEETPELDRYGIHVMASTFTSGEVVIGDSHEYGEEITPFDKVEIDELILRELRKVIRLEDWTIRERWHGMYAKHPEKVIFEDEPEPGVRIFVGPGGAGMTMAFGLADEAWDRWYPELEAGDPVTWREDDDEGLHDQDKDGDE